MSPEPIQDDRPALSLEETADKIGCAPATLRKNRAAWRRTKGFPGTCSPTNRLVWRPEEIEAWLARRAQILGGDGKLEPVNEFRAANEDRRADLAARQRATASTARVVRERQTMAARMVRSL